jgi:hypothetical protein
LPSRAGLADEPCSDLANQIAAQDQQLEQVKNDAGIWLRQASQSALVVPAELAVSTPELAQAYGALAAQVGAEMDLFANTADQDTFLPSLSDHVVDWQSRLAPLLGVASSSPSLLIVSSALQSLSLDGAQALATLALRNDFSKQLVACQQPSTPVLGCGLTYFGLDRANPEPRPRSAVPGLPADAAPGAQWDYATSSDMVEFVDTYRCASDGATKVGRSAIQTFPDGTTTTWGERDYVGTLWPKTIAPGATWHWQTIQYSGDYEEIMNVTVQDAGREQITLPQGGFEAIQLHFEEDVLQPENQSQHFSWDEWYARPLNSLP